MDGVRFYLTAFSLISILDIQIEKNRIEIEK